MTEDAKWLYSELKKRGADVGNTEAEFEQIFTSNEDDMKWLHETSKNMKLDVDDGYDTFVTSFFPKENKEGFLQRTFGNTAQAQMYAKQAEDAAKEKEEERIRQEKINLGISDKDKQDVIELVELEQKAANPVSISASGVMEVHTPQPVLNQYGMPTNVTKPVNPDVERQVETKKAQMPAYLTRGENTAMDITQNAHDRAMNTEEGKNIVTSIENKYKTEFKQSEAYKALLKDFYAGKVTEADINKAFVEQYSQKMDDEIREGILGENGLMREYYDDAQAKLDARLRETEAFDISSRIKAERDKKREDRKNSIEFSRPKYDEQYKEAYKAQFGVYPEDNPLKDFHRKGFNVGYGHKGLDVESIKFDRMLNHAEQFNNDALDLIDAVNNERGFGKGIANALTDIDTFDMGLAELSRTKELIEILDKVEADAQLSEREELMLDAALNYFAVTSYYSNKLGRGYKAGQTTGASLPFIAQFMLTSGALASAEAAVKSGAQSLGKKIVKNLVKHGNKKLGKVLSSKAATAPLATIGGLAEAGLEAGAMTAVFGMPKIEAGTQSRMLGEVNTTYNPETGEMEYLGRTNVQDEKTARRNATVDTYVEYLSEMVLAKAFDPVGEWLRSTNMYKNILRTDIAGAIVDAWSHPTWKNIRTSTKFGSLPEEILEEELGGLLRLGVASDVNTAKEAGLDLDSQIDIVLGLAPTSIMFGAVGAGTYYGSLRRNAKHIRQSLSSDAQRELFDKLMEESRSGQFGDLAHDMIRNIVLDNEMSVEDKKADITSIVGEYQDLLSQETQKLAQQVNETENAANIDEYISNTRNNASDKIYQTIDSKGRVCSIVDGRVEISQNEYGWNQVDQDKSSKKVRVRYRKEDGSFTEPIEMLTSELTAPVNVMNTEKFKEMALAKSLASTKGEETFEYDGVVYDTTTGIAQGTVEEYAQKEEERKKKEEENNINNEPRVNTRPHKINGVFTITVNGKEVDVKVYSNNATQKTDGSIKGGTFSISVDGKVVTGERREMYVEALSEKLKADHAKAVEDYKQRKAEEVVSVEPIAEEPLVSEEDRVQAAAEAEKRAKIDAFPKDKAGNVLVDKLSPEEYFLYIEQENDTETALSFIAEQLSWEYQAIADIEASNKSPREKQTARMKHQSAIKGYEAAIVKYAGQETLDTINAARAEALQNTPHVQEGAPVVAPVVEQAQGETPAEPAVPEQEAPQDDVPAEPDTTPLPPAEPVIDNGEVNEEEKEPMNLLDGQYAIVGSNSTRGKEQIVKVTQNEDGTETWTSIDDGKTVSKRAYKKQQFPEQDNMRVLGIKEGNEITPVIVLSGLADLSQAKGELKVVPVNTKDGKVHEAHVSLLYKQDADGGWSLLKGVGSRVLSPAEAAKYNSLDALLDFPIIPNVTVGNFTLRDMLEYPTLSKLKSRLEQLGIEYDKQTINTNLETALARWRELVRENNLNEEFKNNLDKLSPSTLATYKLYRAGVEPFKAGVPIADTMRTRSNINLYVQLDSIGMLPNNTSNPLAQLAVLAEVASDLGIIQKKANGSYLDAINGILEKTKREVDANAEEFTGKPKEAVEEKATKDKQLEQPKTETPKQQKPKAEVKEETPTPAKRKTNINNLRDAFVESYARTQNQAYNAVQKTIAKTAFKGMIDKMSEEDAIALYLNLAMESAKSQGKMQEDMVNAAKALIDSKHGAAINAITGGAQIEQKEEVPVESAPQTAPQTKPSLSAEERAGLEARRQILQEEIADAEDMGENAYAQQMRDELAKIDAQLNGEQAELMVGSIAESSASQEAKDIIREAVMRLLAKIGIKTHLVTQEEAQRAANAGAELMAKEENLRNGIKALERISKGEEVVYDAMYRSDLEQFGGSPSISFYFGEAGNPNKSYKGGYGISHIASKHGDEMILNALNVIASGRIERVVDGNKTVILTDGTYEVVLSLTRFGEKETWLLSGWKKNETTDGKGEVSTQSLPTQTNPTFSREDLGAAISPAKVNKFIDSTKESTKKNEKSAVEHKNDLSTETLVAGSIVYGYVKGGEIYFTPEGMNPNTPIHEYTHIWAKAMQEHNPKAWKSIVEQLKKAEALWNEVVNDPNYENIKNDEDAIASEVLSRYSGKNGAAKLEAEAERVVSELKSMEKGLKVKALINRVKEALEKFWSWVGKNLFEIESFESVESIADRVLYDMLNSTQLNLDNSKKSSTFEQNNEKGGTRTTTPQEDIEFMIGPAGAPLDPMLFDAEAAAKIQIKTHKLLTTFANPKASLPEEFSAMRELVATSLDRTEGIRWMQESIKKFRKEQGLPELGEGFDVRTMVEAMDSKIQNDTQAYINTTEKRLRKNIKKLVDKVEGSSFYKMHKIERELDQNGNKVELTPLQMIERYLIACDSIEREQLNGNPRGLADFYRRMGMDVYEFAEAFNSAFFSSSKGKQQFDELWDSIRACTNVSIDMGWQSGLISFEEYTEYKKRRYYVPERDFAEVENNEELAIDSHGYRGRSSNKLTAMKQAKGGDSLAANVLANICLHARDGIIKSHRNVVKKAMFDLLKANEEWCREYKVPIPKQVWYQKNEDGTVSRMVDGPSAEDRKLMADLKSQIRDIENEIINLQQLADATTDESVKEAYENDIADLREQIDMLTDMFPYLDEFDTRSFIFMTNAAKNESTVMVYVDGVAQEMVFPNMSIIAKALNGTYNKEGELEPAKKIGQAFAAGLTVYNPAFFTVNVTRDIPFILKKGSSEYGFMFAPRFIARLAEKLFNRNLWKVVWNSDYKSLKDEHLREFFAGGANTGYTTIPEIRKLKEATKGWAKKTSIGWSDVKDLLSYMNTFSEVWTRSAAYSVVRDMGHTNEEAIKAAKNLSVNFNRKGLGNPFMNFFGSMSIFMNAAIQGACGYWRTFKGNEDTLPQQVWHGTRAAINFMLLPAFVGFIDTLLNPDDDDEKLYYSDYDRDNYALLGFLHEGIRIPLNEQVKPFWCLGVNIALGMQNRRTKEQITNSMVSTVVTNLLPLPPVLNSTIVMAANGLTGQKDFTPFQVVENMITPQALSGIYDLSNNVNFMGTDIRIEAGDRPQYMLGENEEYFCRQVAWWAYLKSGGNRDYPSRTTTDGDKIWADWNPKQVSAVRNMVIPSTYRDVTDFFTRVIVNAAFPDNPYHGEEAKWEDFATVRRFYKPRDREMGMYSITKDAKAIVKANNERKANAQKLVKGGAITKNDAMRDEAELRLRQTLSNRDAEEMSTYITIYEQLSIRERAKEYGLTEKQFMKSLHKNNPSAYNILIYNQNVKREDAADKLLQLTRKYKSISIEDMTLLDFFGVE